MTARSLLLCCGAFVALGAASLTPVVSPAIARTASVEPAIDDAPLAFPGSVREVGTLIVAAGETLTVQGPIEFRVAGEVRIDGRIVVDGVESTGRPNLTIKSLGPMIIGKNAVLQTLSFGPGAHGGSIRLRSAKTIALHGKLVPSEGLSGDAVAQHGGNGADVDIEAPVITTSVDRILATDGGDGGPAGNGGSGGSVRVHGSVIWTGDPVISNATIVAGNGGRGGDGLSVEDNAFRNGGDGGDGGRAEAQQWLISDWLDETGVIANPTEARRSSWNARKGTNGEPGSDGGHGQHGVNAIAGSGGLGGNGADAMAFPTDEQVGGFRFVAPGNGGSGGDGGHASAGAGGDGGDGGSNRGLPSTHVDFGTRGGSGGPAGNGGNAEAGHGGSGGMGGIYPFRDPFPPRARGRAGHGGHAGNAGHAFGGDGGDGGDGGRGFGEVPQGGIAGVGGSAVSGFDGVRGEDQPNAQFVERDSGHAIRGRDGNDGRAGYSIADEAPK